VEFELYPVYNHSAILDAQIAAKKKANRGKINGWDVVKMIAEMNKEPKP
jgi:hypothetical protein